MPLDKRNLITAIATVLISSLFNVASSRDVPFCQLQQLHCLHHGSTKALPLFSFVLHSFLLFRVGDNLRYARYGFGMRLVVQVGEFLHYSLLENLAKHSKSLGAKRSAVIHRVKMTYPLLKSITGACASTIVHSVFSIIAGLIVEMLFMLFSVYKSARNGLNMSEYEVYWLTDLPLIIYWVHTKK